LGDFKYAHFSEQVSINKKHSWVSYSFKTNYIELPTGTWLNDQENEVFYYDGIKCFLYDYFLIYVNLNDLLKRLDLDVTIKTSEIDGEGVWKFENN